MIGHHHLTMNEIEHQVEKTEQAIKDLDDLSYDLLDNLFQQLAKKPYASLSLLFFY